MATRKQRKVKPDIVYFDDETVTMGPKVKPMSEGIYKAKGDGLPPRTPFNWAYFKEGRWGPVVRSPETAEMEWAIEGVKLQYGRKLPARKIVWRGVER